MSNAATAEQPTQFRQDQEEGQFDNGYQAGPSNQGRQNARTQRPRNYPQNNRSTTPDETVVDFQGEDGMKWVGIGGCAIGAGLSVIAMALCIHGLLAGNSSSGIRQNNWR